MCATQQQTRTCYTGSCPVEDGDYLVFLDMRVRVEPSRWSYVYSEAFFAAFAILFEVRESSMELLNDASTEYTMGVKLHFQLRLRRKDFDSVMDLHKAAQSIPLEVWGPRFGADFLEALNKVSLQLDKLDFSRFGYLLPEDVEILNAMALPIGDVRDPVEVPMDDHAPVIYDRIKGGIGISNQIDLLLAGVALGALALMFCVLCMYYRLRQEHAALEKDKVMGGSLRRMWNRFTRLESMKGSSFGRGARGSSVEMNKFAAAVESGALLSAEGDDELLDGNGDR